MEIIFALVLHAVNHKNKPLRLYIGARMTCDRSHSHKVYMGAFTAFACTSTCTQGHENVYSGDGS